ncbi:DUF1015 domain-containing protein [Vallitalea sp.]|jgi:uncharacterized protein (DUF1015 family)|uniref:DUF1015 domain-containing protein n=1 Tax=Vallitalea sp. TaxID=1882829 RepID=UPI0025D76050|nr:DUF1015 family protein [Vallitalea sp.]MCT4687201.1 DUF1015 family protein [Vallitalea sp.]
MAIIRPFCGIRPATKYAENIAALPYDVYNREEAVEEVKGKPYSFLRIDRAEVEMDMGIDTYDKKVYQHARDKFDEFVEKGYFIQDDKPCLYLYELEMNGRKQLGIVTCTSVDDYLNNNIKKHELTREAKEQDRINHVDYLDANTGPIFLTYRAEQEINALMDKYVNDNIPIYDFTADDEISHRVWVVEDDKLIEQLVMHFKNIDSLYIADGHHRAASAVKVAVKRRKANPDYDGTEEFNFFLSVVFPDEQLYIMDYNRVVKDLNNYSVSELINEVERNFVVEEIGSKPYKPAEKLEFGMFVDSKWYKLRAKDQLKSIDDPVRSLDVSILYNYLLQPILDIGDPRIDKRIDFVGGIRGLKELERRAQSDMKIAFSMYPTKIEELMNIADASKLMPPKSTWFEPKLRSGLLIHKLS